LPNLVDVNWRLGFDVRSSAVGKVNEPVYLLKMTTRNDKGDLEDVEVSLDQHQLLDMRRKVQDATTQVHAAQKMRRCRITGSTCASTGSTCAESNRPIATSPSNHLAFFCAVAESRWKIG